MKVEVHPADVVTVHVPMRFVKHGGRKEIVLPVEMLKHQGADQSRGSVEGPAPDERL